MCHIVTIQLTTASGGTQSADIALVDYAQRLLHRQGVHTSAILVSDGWCGPESGYPSEAMVAANVLLEEADGVIVAIPAQRNEADRTSAETLQAFLAQLPIDIMQHKVVLPVITGACEERRLAMEAVVNGLIRNMGTQRVLSGLRISCAQIQFEHGGVVRLTEGCVERLKSALNDLTAGQRTLRSRRPAITGRPLLV